MVSSESSVMVSSMSVVWRLLIFTANKLLSHSLTFSYLLKIMCKNLHISIYIKLGIIKQQPHFIDAETIHNIHYN